MSKTTPSAAFLLQQLGELSTRLGGCATHDVDSFEAPLRIIHETLGFHISVLYKVRNVIEDTLILEVVAVRSPEHERPDLREGAKIVLSLEAAQPVFVNEVTAFRQRGISAINVPGWGCDIVGYIDMPESLGHGYLLAGDYFGAEVGSQESEICAFEIMCNLLSALLMKSQFERLAVLDELTGLLNSRAIRAELEQAVQRHRRRKRGMSAVVLCDIDFFKKINDDYGHIQGDAVLQEIGALFANTLRKYSDIGGRFGGEEFLLIYDDFESTLIESVVDRLRNSIANHPFRRIGPDGGVLAGESLRVTMSFGIALLEESSQESAIEILARADAALYLSKGAGRNRVTLATF